MLAEVSAHLNYPADGLQALAEAHTLMEQHEERWWEAEVHRLRGVLLLRQPGTPQVEAEAWLQRALDVARRQEAKSLELRAAMSLSRLWQQQAKQAEAQALLSPSMAGSPKGSTPRICKRPRRCSMLWRNTTLTAPLGRPGAGGAVVQGDFDEFSMIGQDISSTVKPWRRKSAWIDSHTARACSTAACASASVASGQSPG